METCDVLQVQIFVIQMFVKPLLHVKRLFDYHMTSNVYNLIVAIFVCLLIK